MEKIISANELWTARAALRLSREQVATAAGVSAPTIKNLELGHVRGKPYQASADLSTKLIAFFESQGLEFLPEKVGRAFGVDVAKGQN